MPPSPSARRRLDALPNAPSPSPSNPAGTLPLTKAPLHISLRPRRHLASAEGFLDIVEWLLSYGVDPNPVDRFKRTPLEVG